MDSVASDRCAVAGSLPGSKFRAKVDAPRTPAVAERAPEARAPGRPAGKVLPSSTSPRLMVAGTGLGRACLFAATIFTFANLSGCWLAGPNAAGPATATPVPNPAPAPVVSDPPTATPVPEPPTATPVPEPPTATPVDSAAPPSGTGTPKPMADAQAKLIPVGSNLYTGVKIYMKSSRTLFGEILARSTNCTKFPDGKAVKIRLLNGEEMWGIESNLTGLATFVVDEADPAIAAKKVAYLDGCQ